MAVALNKKANSFANNPLFVGIGKIIGDVSKETSKVTKNIVNGTKQIVNNVVQGTKKVATDVKKEAVKIARLARECTQGDFIKIEVIKDSKYLLPDNYETIKATEILAKEGFIVMPYMYPDLNVARALRDAGASCIMPLGAPIGSNRGLITKEFIKILIDEIDLPIIVDAGIGKPSQACEAMEMGVTAIMANTAIATASDIPRMAQAFKYAIQAGRDAYLAKLGRVLENGASASSPLTGFLNGED